MDRGNILLFVPNIIGYIRIVLTIAAFIFYKHSLWFVILYGVSVSLDGLDGYAARKLKQCSDFGAWFDVVVDLFSRGLLWCSLYQYGYIVIFVEWLTFACTHCRGAKWRIPEDTFPWLVTRVMANGFKTPWGAAAISGLHILPLWLYAYESGFFTTVLSLPAWTQMLGIAALTVGRVICLCVELFYIYNHISALLQCDSSREDS